MLGAFQRHPHTTFGLLVALDGFLQKIEIADHDAEHVVEIMRDPARETADRFELAGVEQVLLHLLALRDIEPHAEELARTTVLIPHENRLVEKVSLDIVGAAPSIFE